MPEVKRERNEGMNRMRATDWGESESKGGTERERERGREERIGRTRRSSE